MKRLICALTGSFIVVVAGAVVLVGQTSVQKQGANTYDPSKTQTVSGCLRPGEMAGSFVLTDAAEVKPATGGAKPVGTSGVAVAKKTYAIKGLIPPGVDLSKHVNHKVEVAGTIISDPIAVNMHTFKHVGATCGS